MILLALGSNLVSPAGSPADTLSAALAALKANGIRPAKVSRFYETKAWPDPSQPVFINAVARVDTALAQAPLLAQLHAIEAQFGRRRGARNSPRPLDIDIIDYNSSIEEGPPTLPHPRMETRGFVLIPLAEIAPEWRHPVSQRSASELVSLLPDAEDVRPLSEAARYSRRRDGRGSPAK